MWWRTLTYCHWNILARHFVADELGFMKIHLGFIDFIKTTYKNKVAFKDKCQNFIIPSSCCHVVGWKTSKLHPNGRSFQLLSCQWSDTEATSFCFCLKVAMEFQHYTYKNRKLKGCKLHFCFLRPPDYLQALLWCSRLTRLQTCCSALHACIHHLWGCTWILGWASCQWALSGFDPWIQLGMEEGGERGGRVTTSC